MTIVDSSVWIAWLDKDDSQHHAALSAMNAAWESTVEVPEYVVVEVCTILARKGKRDIAIGFLATIADHENIELMLSDERLYEGAKQAFMRNDHASLSFTDASLLHLSQQYEVITFDRALQKALQAG